MRLTTLVIDAVGDDRIVIVNDSTGAEVVVNVKQIPTLARDVHEALTGAALTLLVSDDTDSIMIPMSEYAQVSFALGYFWGVLGSYE